MRKGVLRWWWENEKSVPPAFLTERSNSFFEKWGGSMAVNWKARNAHEFFFRKIVELCRQSPRHVVFFLRRRALRNAQLHHTTPQKNMKAVFLSRFASHATAIQLAMEYHMVEFIKNTLTLTNNGMVNLYDELTAKEFFPDQELTEEERREIALQWAADAYDKALRGLASDHVMASILKRSIG